MAVPLVTLGLVDTSWFQVTVIDLKLKDNESDVNDYYNCSHIWHAVVKH